VLVDGRRVPGEPGVAEAEVDDLEVAPVVEPQLGAVGRDDVLVQAAVLELEAEGLEGVLGEERRPDALDVVVRGDNLCTTTKPEQELI
jgi:hypothetical protein